MDDRFDTPNRFVCRAETGTQTDLLRLFTDMPIDCTVGLHVRSNGRSQPGDRFTAEGATIEVTFSQMWLRQWESPTRDWLVQFIKDHASDQFIHCVLLHLDPTDDDSFCFGIEHWNLDMRNDDKLDVVVQRDGRQESIRRSAIAPAVTPSDARPPAGLTVAEQLRWRAEQRGASGGGDGTQGA